MRRLPLRWVLLGTVLGAITLAFTAFALYVDRVEQSNRLDDIDAELVRAERGGTTPASVDRPAPPPPDDGEVDADAVDAPIQLVVDPDGNVVANSGASNPFSATTLAALTGGDDNLTTQDPRFRVRTATTPEGGLAVTALSLEAFDAAVQRLRVALVAGGGVILGLVAAMLWVLTGWVTRPVVRMTESARRVAAGDLETPVGSPAGTRETADLAVDLDAMVGRLRRALGAAHQSRDATERLLADMAHEIRTPLTALKGYSDLYARGMLDDEGAVDRAMARIGSESERLNTLASSMLQLALEQTEELAAEEFDLGEVADEVVTDLRAAHPDQRLELLIVDRGPHRLRGSRDRIQQALLNLGSNACQHSPTGAPVVLEVQRGVDDLVVRVADRGPGVEPADHARIFLPFYRSDAARSRDGHNGAGLGLALVRQIAEQHHGTVSVESNAHGGATFVLRVPAPSGVSPSSTGGSAAARPGPSPNR